MEYSSAGSSRRAEARDELLADDTEQREGGEDKQHGPQREGSHSLVKMVGGCIANLRVHIVIGGIWRQPVLDK